MKNFFYCIVILFTGVIYSQPKDILVDWECNMEIEILSGRFNPAADTVAARGNFNGWGRFDLEPDAINPNNYVSPFPILFPQLEVGDTVAIYKFFYTPNTWETGNDKIYVLTQDDYNAGAATISRPFNDATLQTVTNQPTTITFTVDCNNAISALTGLPFPEINTCHIAGGTAPLQWPSLGWPDNEIGVMIPMYDDGTNGDPIPGDLNFTALVTFPAYTIFEIQYKYGINYGDPINNGGGNDNENAIGSNHIIELEQLLGSAQVINIFGQMGFHPLINPIYVPVELTSFTAQLNDNQVLLQWQTATETNNQGFEIERASSLPARAPDGTSPVQGWERIGFVEGHGTTTEPQNYIYNDDISNINATSFSYRLKQIDYDGSFEYSDEIEVINSILPDEFSLSQNYPNPFNPTTSISFGIPAKSHVIIKVFNSVGQEIVTLVNDEKSAGTHKVEWNAVGLPSGVYYYTLKTENFTQTNKMILMK